MHSATVMRITDQQGDRCVVTHADPVIWIAPELLDQAKDPDRQRIPGDMEVSGDLVAFGVAGEGIGRLAYRLVGERVDDYGTRWHVAEREVVTNPVQPSV